LGYCRIFVGPIVAAAGQHLHPTGIETGVHSIAIKFDFVQPVGTVWRLFNQCSELWLDPSWRMVGNGAGFDGSNA
jgi:hypothetical protein